MFRYFSIIIILLILMGFFSSGVVYSVNKIDRSQFGNVTMKFKDMDILNVLRIFSMQTGLSIVAGQDVRARVTLFLKDVNAWDAFEVILAANNLAYRVEGEGKIIKVLTERSYEKQYGKPFYEKTITKSIRLRNARAEDVSNALNQIRSGLGKVIVDVRSNTVIIQDTPEMVEKMEKVIKSIEVSPITKVFTLKYADPEKMLEKVKENLTEGIGSVEMDKRSMKIVVTDIPPKVEQISKMIKSFDEKSREVLIEAKIVEVSLNRAHKLGIDWANVFSKNLKAGVNIEHGGLVYYSKIPSEGLEVILEALKTRGEVRVISQPKVLALNHKEAKIKIAERQPYVTTTVSAVGETTQVGESITFIDIGTQLTVTPTINPDGYITMKIKPKISSAPDYFRYTSSYGGVRREIPIERTSEAETTLMVKDGHTIVIGGLMKEKVKLDKTRVPVLSNIPVLGGLFRHQERTTEDTELAIFLTPHIMTGKGREEVAKLEKEGKISPPVSRKKPTFSWLKKGKKSAYTDYYLALSSLLSKYIAENYSPTTTGGRVNLILTINSNGELIGEPKVTNTPSAKLAQIAKGLITQASPFPPFPQALQKRQENFRISVNLPPIEGKPPAFLTREREGGELSSEDMAYSEYYLTLSELISNYMVRNYPSTKGGRVEIVFKLSNQGELIGRPEIVNEINPQLRELTIQAMRELSPFPPFPEQVKARQKTFRILITIPEGKISKNIKRGKTLTRLEDLGSWKNEYNLSSSGKLQYNPSELSYNEYKRYISKKISKFINPPPSGLKGEVKVAFTLDNNGGLVGSPEIIRSPNEILSRMTIQAVKKASPFHKLPQAIARNQAIFEISIVYK